MKAQNWGGIIHTANVTHLRLAVGLAGTLYLAGNQDGSLYAAPILKRFSAGAWSAMPIAGLPAAVSMRGQVVHPTTGQPWISVAVVDSREQYHETYSVRLFRFDGVQWQAVGQPIPTCGSVAGGADFKDPGQRTLAFHPITQTPYVLVDDPGASSWRLRAYRLDGETWTALGAEISTGNTLDGTLAFASNGDLYVAYCDRYANDATPDFDGAAPEYGSSDRATIKRWDGATWQILGASPKYATHLALAVNPMDGWPWIAYRDGKAGYKITVRCYTGSQWVVVGTAGLGVDYPTDSVRLALSPAGQPYVTVIDRDAEGINRLALYTWVADQWAKVWGKAGLTVSQNHYDLAWFGEHPPVLAAIQYQVGGGLMLYQTVESENPALLGAASLTLAATGTLMLGVPPGPGGGDPGGGDPGGDGEEPPVVPAPTFTAVLSQNNSYGNQYTYTVTADPALTVEQIEVEIKYVAWTAKKTYSQAASASWTDYGQKLMRARVLTAAGVSPWTLIFQTQAAGPVAVRRDPLDARWVTLTWSSNYLYSGDFWEVFDADSGALLKSGIWKAPQTTLMLPTATATRLRILSHSTPEVDPLLVTAPAVTVLPGATAAHDLVAARDADNVESVRLAWQGTLVPGDQWVVIGQRAYDGQQTLLAQTTENAVTATLERWNDYRLIVQPGGNPALKASVTLAAALPEPLPVYSLSSAVVQASGQTKLIYAPLAAFAEAAAYGVQIVDGSTSLKKTVWLSPNPVGDGRYYALLTIERPRVCTVRPVASFRSNGRWVDSPDGPDMAIGNETDPSSWLFLKLTPKWIGKSVLQLQLSKNPVLYQRATLSVTVTVDGQPSPAIVVTPQGFASVILGNVLSPEAGQPARELACTVRVVNPELHADVSATYTETLEPLPALPPEPWSLDAQLIQQAEGQRPDLVQLSWSAETAVRLIASVKTGNVDPATGAPLQKDSFLCFADSTEEMAFIEDCRRFLPRDGKLHEVSFYAQGYRLGVVSSGRVPSGPVRIRAHSPEGYSDATAERWDDAALVRFLTASLSAAYPDLPPTLREVAAQLTLTELLEAIKGVVALGGRVSLADFGEFRAAWSQDSGFGATFKPAERGLRFKASKGFVAGVRRGQVLTDAQAAALAEAEAEPEAPAENPAPAS